MSIRRITALAAALLSVAAIAATTTGASASAARGVHTVTVQAADFERILVAQPGYRGLPRPDARIIRHPLPGARVLVQPDVRWFRAQPDCRGCGLR